ncbi:MAG: hypothetical protein HYY29_00305 [Chloroflexi bacterium]|nr:hypothetical protein [Chloroflexota bacterium]
MEESKVLFEALARSDSRARIMKRMEKAPVSGMALAKNAPNPFPPLTPSFSE